MRYLYIDTSSPFLYAGLVEDDNLLAERQKELRENLSKDAIYEIAEMFKEANLSPDDVDKIIVINGPGSFTGIRIGLTIAKVYAWAKEIPITTASSLLAMAISSDNNKIHVPMLDARRDFVYTAIYDENYEEILKPQHIERDKIIEKLKDLSDYEVISNDNFTDITDVNRYKPNILKIVEHLKDKESINPHAANPDYLKLTAAEERINE
ncbi:MAG: tRNA (adenosine(37)-N6)-threonylcarbamoyltransferase complex dimerization subunit type 1 TsaB [Bacilli bacterium]|nr:tRNA (adenosine(37)-N6)-threonylcarbamoyltransferase complex dimerization subunit type 1 TsaB [Bacilli bacterium]